MTNQDYVRIFNELADLMELKNENPFRIGAMRKAARAIEALTENVEDLYHADKLKDIPGIGTGIHDRIGQIIQTGTCKDYKKLKEEIPEGLLQMLQIPEVGPKTVQLVWQKLNITTIEELEKAAKEGKLRNLFRMGEKTEKNILKGIELIKRGKGRFLLGEALPIVEYVVNTLSKLKEVEKISPCGSIRRYKETVGDIDILIVSSQPEIVMDRFVSLPLVKRILAKGKTKSSVLTNIDLQMDLRVIPADCFGAALQYFTGSKEHNIALREMAKHKKLKISEYGVFKEKTNEKIGGEKEEDIYTLLNLPWIPPELRENLGEIEAAKNNQLPNLVTYDDIKGDLHIHSTFSDGAYTIEELVEVAQNKGYKFIAITDHSKGLRITGGVDEKRLKKQMELIKELNNKNKKFKILTGIEVDIKPDGSLDLDDAILKEVDIVFAAVHLKFKMTKDEMTNRIVKAIKNKNVDVIAHPTGRLIGKRAPYEVEIEDILSACAETGTAVEINANPERLDLRDIYLTRAKEYGIKIVIGTDAHQKGQIEFMKYGVYQCRRAWAEKNDIINTMEYDELIEWLRNRR